MFACLAFGTGSVGVTGRTSLDSLIPALDNSPIPTALVEGVQLQGVSASTLLENRAVRVFWFAPAFSFFWEALFQAQHTHGSQPESPS